MEQLRQTLKREATKGSKLYTAISTWVTATAFCEGMDQAYRWHRKTNVWIIVDFGECQSTPLLNEVSGWPIITQERDLSCVLTSFLVLIHSVRQETGIHGQQRCDQKCCVKTLRYLLIPYYLYCEHRRSEAPWEGGRLVGGISGPRGGWALI